MKSWVRLPTAWIEARGLRDFRWEQGKGSAAAAALMVLSVIAHHADEETGGARLTYDELTTATSLSRTMVSHGLKVLAAQDVVRRTGNGRSNYELVGFNPAKGWGKLPARGLYRDGTIDAFRDFQLRRTSELDALKAYFTFVARRDNATNLASLSYDKIDEYAGIPRNRIKGALSLLIISGLVHVEHLPSQKNENHISNAYRLVHIDSYRHMGTAGRRSILEGGMPNE